MSLEELSKKAAELKRKRDKKSELEAELKELDDNIRVLEEREINTLMLDLGISSVVLGELEVKRDVVYRGGVLKHTDKDAFRYLFDTNNDGALKHQITIDLLEYPEAELVLMEAGVAFEPIYSIHHATLSSILKELVTTGKFNTDDIERYSVYAQPKIGVKIKK